MSPYLKRGSTVYQGRVHDRHGRRYVRSMGTRNAKEADRVQAFCADLRTRREWHILEAIISGKMEALEAYLASFDGTLPERMSRIEQADAEASEPDADALVTEWSREARSAKYVRQVRTLIPEGQRFPISRLTRSTIAKHLASLSASGPTRNRYRVAFSQFCRWLVERDVLETNPVREVRGYKEHDPRMVYYSREERRRIVERTEWLRYGAAEAFMWGAGLELQAVLALRRRDVVSMNEVHARGHKTRWRNRVVRITEPEAWAIIEAYIRDFLPETPLFQELSARRMLEAHQEACALAGVERSTLHDWRHTYAVQALKDGMHPQTVKRQLGHSPHSTMVERVYGAWLPKTDADYVATNLATKAPARAANQGAK